MRRDLAIFALPVDVERIRLEVVWPERRDKAPPHCWRRKHVIATAKTGPAGA